MTEHISIEQFRALPSRDSKSTLRQVAEDAIAARPVALVGREVRKAGEDTNWQIMRFVLPMPPSANRYWRNYRGVVVVSEEARAYKAGVGESAKEQGAFVLSCPVAVYVDVYRSRKAGDLDNRLKVVLDALKGVAFEDDKQVVEIHARRFDDAKNGRIEITIEAA